MIEDVVLPIKKGPSIASSLLQYFDEKYSDFCPYGEELLRAAEKGQLAKVEELLTILSKDKDVFDVNYQDKEGWTGLMWACHEGQKETVALMLKLSYQIDVNCESIYNSTALIFACQEGHKEIVQLLLYTKSFYKVDVNHGTAFGTTALILACQAGRIDVLKILLCVTGININKASNFGYTALIYSCIYEHSEVALTLLQDRRLDRTCENCNGSNALVIAREKGMMDVVQRMEELNDTLVTSDNDFTSFTSDDYLYTLETLGTDDMSADMGDVDDKGDADDMGDDMRASDYTSEDRCILADFMYSSSSDAVTDAQTAEGVGNAQTAEGNIQSRTIIAAKTQKEGTLATLGDDMSDYSDYTTTEKTEGGTTGSTTITATTTTTINYF